MARINNINNKICFDQLGDLNRQNNGLNQANDDEATEIGK
jgi:hypothetical protein